MKFTSLALLSVIGLASAAKPQLSLTVRDGIFDGVDALDPTLLWEDATKSGDFDFSYGIRAGLRPTSDLGSLPKTIWGKVRTEFQGWGVSARAEIDGQDFQSADVEINGNNEEMDLSVKAEATVAPEVVLVNTVQATKGFDQDGARITINPRYNVQTEEKDVVVTYAKDKTEAKLTASQEYQEVTVSQQVDDKNRIAPTVNNNGDISVEWERTISETGSVLANLKPNDFLDITWKDGDWKATANMGIDGTEVKGCSVSVKRNVIF